MSLRKSGATFFYLQPCEGCARLPNVVYDPSIAETFALPKTHS